MSGVGAVTSATEQKTTSIAGKSSISKDAFLQLLIAQLKQQDPLSPVQNTEFIAQMAQLASLEQLQSLNANLSQLLALQQQAQEKEELIYAAGLLGRGVEARNPQTGETYRELVKGYNQKGGEIWLICTEHEIPLTWVYRAEIPSGQGDV